MKSEKIIIARKERGLSGNRSGFVKPLFEINENGDIKTVTIDEYPNNGLIFISDYELLDTDIDGQLFIMDNCFFIDDDKSYPQNQSEPTSSKKRINYNIRISNFFNPPFPFEYIPIYDNQFDLQKRRLISTRGIETKIFFLKATNEITIYGPFERDGSDLKAVNFYNLEEDWEDQINYREFLEDFNDYDGSIIYKYIEKDVDNYTIIDNSNQKYIKDFRQLIKFKIGEIIEFTPISILQSWAIDKISSSPDSPKEIINKIKNIDIFFTSSVEGLKWERYLEFLGKIEERNEMIDHLIRILYDKGFYGKISENKELEQKEKEIERLADEINLKNEEIVELKDMRAELETQLFEKEENNPEILDAKTFPNLANVLKQSEEDKKQIDELISNKQQFDKLNSELDKLKIRKEVIIEDIKNEDDNLRKIKDSVRKIKKSFDEDVSDHTAKLAEAKIYTDLLNGINIENKKTINENEYPIIKVRGIPKEITNPRTYILDIQKRLKSRNRDYSFNDVLNLVITVNQSFLTIIVGAPGVGKTSLVSKFANSCGLGEDLGYLEINCARGWTSSKDLLGFYNPLTGKYQEAKTRLVRAIKTSCNNLNSPYFVLLDEANLSPMEHYWSDFIKLADLEYDRTIKLSQSESVTFGNGFRFLATINHDHTTEYLSNRLIDRASIIQIDRPNNIIEADENYDVYESVHNYNEIVRLFNETSKWKSDEELIKKLLKQTIEKIESHNNGIIISPRKELAIKKYCKVCTGLMEGNTYAALDYAIAQHILPIIKGRGESFETTLKQLKGEFNDKGMNKSEKLITKIIERGKDLKQFKYIYY